MVERVAISDLETMADVKLALHKRLGIPAEKQALFRDSVVISDGKWSNINTRENTYLHYGLDPLILFSDAH